MPPDKQTLETALLIVRCQRGDRSAFEDIVKLWERPLFYYLRRLCESEPDAWEMLQESWLKIFRTLRTLRDPCAFPAFLYTTARNTAISRMRSRELKEIETAEGVQGELAGDDIAAFDNIEHAHYALDQLPVLQREALTLFFLQDLSMDEMAALLGVPLGTVKSRLHYAKVAIRKILMQGENRAG